MAHPRLSRVRSAERRHMPGGHIGSSTHWVGQPLLSNGWRYVRQVERGGTYLAEGLMYPSLKNFQLLSAIRSTSACLLGSNNLSIAAGRCFSNGVATSTMFCSGSPSLLLKR